jgi:hypothetical protein
VDCLYALKSGVGFDYFTYRPKPTFRPPNERRKRNVVAEARAASKQAGPDESRPVKFVLGGVHKMRVHVVDEHRRSLAGVRVAVVQLERPNRGGPAVLSGVKEMRAATDREGIAEFNAIPIETSPVVIFSSGWMDYDFEAQPNFDPSEQTTDFRIVARPRPVLRVELVYPNGQPALGAQIHFSKHEFAGGGNRSGYIRYDAAGVHDVIGFFSDAYCVLSATNGRFASAMEARIARLGQPMRPVHLVLQPAARVHGTLTVGHDRRPAANESVTLFQHDDDNYSKLPEDERPPRVQKLAADIRLTPQKTDAQGRFEWFVAPGHYVIAPGFVRLADENEEAKEFQIKDQQDVEINLHSQEGEPELPAKRTEKSK